MSIYQLVSVPAKEKGSKVIEELKIALKGSSEKETQAWDFDIPELKVGNIDSLIYLSDELKKSTATVEGTIRKVATQYYELKEDKSEKGEKEKDKDKDKKTVSIEIKNSKPEDHLTRFKWEDARYPRKKGLPELTQTIKGAVAGIEKELRDLTAEYNNQLSKLSQITANESGNLLTRDINAVIKEYNSRTNSQYVPIESKINDEKKKLIEEFNSNAPHNQQFTSFLTTLYVVIPKNEQKTWVKSYESIVEPPHFIVPNSSIKLAEDSDSVMNSIIVFTKDVEDFKTACRIRRYTVRKNDPSTIVDETEKQNLIKNLEKSKQKLERWTLANFGEAFNGWLHLKSIQCYVESILRYGLCDFKAILLLPKRGTEKRLTKFLCKFYSYLGGGTGIFDLDDDGGGGGGGDDKSGIGSEKYFPYVSLEINMSHL